MSVSSEGKTTVGVQKTVSQQMSCLEVLLCKLKNVQGTAAYLCNRTNQAPLAWFMLDRGA